jgi:CRISPR-associated endonuclease/helicase Cas3
VGELRRFVEGGQRAWVWDAVDARWRLCRGADLRPGAVALLAAAAGGYTRETGWDPASTRPVEPIAVRTSEADANHGDPLTGPGVWLDLARHSRDVEAHVAALLRAALDGAAPSEAAEVLGLAARGHDVGKALRRFQEMLLGSAEESEREALRATLWAKSKNHVLPKQRNPRHELASALALLQSGWLAERLPYPWADLVLYLVAAHHGRARVTIRPWPQDEAGVQVLGVRDGDPMREVRLDGLALPAMELHLDPLRLGDGVHGGSWATRMLRLRDHPELGPFRMAHVEALLRAADWRASEEEAQRG